MKKILLITLSIFFLFACENKKSETKELLKVTDSLVGEWQLIEQNVSIGGPSTWESVKNGTTFTLNEDDSIGGSFLHNECTTGAYEVTENELILDYDCQDSEQFIYSLTRDGADIILTPWTVRCIEVCQYKYCRIGQ